MKLKNNSMKQFTMIFQIITIESLLRKFFGAEVIQGASCDRCVELRNKTSSGLIKRQGFCKLPSTLIMRVERVTYLPSGVVFKQGDHFTFPEILDIRDFCFYRDTMVNSTSFRDDYICAHLYLYLHSFALI
ncbi:unnamed protein product [Anisakis simplex]|uniref:Peptidase C19 ubiquitin carboxyl-terminal hydrolase domain-containing protein n=1 Tax=Anisakis simplex TaxID=6269 RepID=A0A3P6PML2_ANISI|nr:unnamed protein product [Anisakis simplex]